MMVIAASSLIAKFLSSDSSLLMLVFFLAIYIVIDNLAIFFQAIFRAYEKMEYEAICRILQSLILLAFSAIFIFNNSSIINISYGFVLSSLASLVFSLFALGTLFSISSFKIKPKTWGKLFSGVWPFLFSGIFYMLYYETSSIMLGMFSTMENVGYFNAAYNLFIAVFLVPDIITMSFFPKLSFYYQHDKKEFQKNFLYLKKIMIIVGLFFSFILFFLSGFIISKIYSPDYSVSTSILKILSLIIVFKFLSHTYTWFLTSSDEQKQNFKIQGFAALLNIVLNYILIGKYNVMGAAVATVITELFLLVFYFLFFKIKFKKINLLLNS
jgi:O-antigen/teichoic acid export membrane protein